jgi:hypothetical protein
MIELFNPGNPIEGLETYRLVVADAELLNRHADLLVECFC